MNKWKALLPVVTAFAEGKTVQERNGHRDKWRDITAGITPAFSMDVENYRVKPEPREFWVNVYNTGRELGTQNEGYLHLTEASALRGRGNGAGRTDIATIKVREVIE